MKRVLLFWATLVLVFGCTDKHSIKELAGEWNVVEANGFGINNPEAIIVLSPKEGKAYGALGCNPFTTTISVESGKLSFGEILTSFTACERLEQELVIKNSLEKVVGYEVLDRGNTLSLLAEGEVVIVRLKKMSEELPKPPVVDLGELENKMPYYEYLPIDSLVGTWEVVRIGESSFFDEQSELPIIIFDIAKKEALGNLGCNDFGAQLVFEEPNHIRFENIFSTRMLCEDMSKEKSMSIALEQTRLFGVVEDGMVWLLKEDETRLLLLRRKL